MNIVNARFTVVEDHYLVLIYKVIISCILDYSGNIGSYESLVFANAYYQRRILAHGVNAVREIFEHHAQRVRAFYLAQHLLYSRHGVALVVIVEQLCNCFGVGLALESVAFLYQKSLYFLVILDYSVMYYGNSCAAVGMRVYVRGFAVGSPAGVTNAAGAVYPALFLQLLLQYGKSAL